MMNIYVPNNGQRTTVVRMIRNGLLVSTDWTQLPDCPLSDEDKQAWAEWRSYVRSLNVDELSAGENPIVLDDSPVAGRPAGWERFAINPVVSEADNGLV